VTGAGGFLGHHLVRALKKRGDWVRGVDLKEPQFEPSDADEFVCADLREFEACLAATQGVDEVYNLAADMGGIGFITRYFASVARNNSLINLHMLEASRQNGVERILQTSSACIYNQGRQREPGIAGLQEEDAYPAAPERGYGWEKLYTEQLCDYYRQDYGLDARVVRLHNVYGPLGAYDGGREKAPAAACRKVALAEPGGTVEIWGDGRQSRSFLYVDDCITGLLRLMDSGCPQPVNLGSEESVTISQLFDLVAEIAGKSIVKAFNPAQPQGVRGRNSDNRRLKAVVGWAPATPLRVGLVATYRWIERQIIDRKRQPVENVVRDKMAQGVSAV
jgi:nucleoside-diphosphate-sugar epimerase